MEWRCDGQEEEGANENEQEGAGRKARKVRTLQLRVCVECTVRLQMDLNADIHLATSSNWRNFKQLAHGEW